MGVLTMELGVKDRVALVFERGGRLRPGLLPKACKERDGRPSAGGYVNEAGLANVHEAIDAAQGSSCLAFPWALGDPGAIELGALKRRKISSASVDILVNNIGGQCSVARRRHADRNLGPRVRGRMVASAILITAGVLPSTRVGEASHHERLLRSRHAHPQSCNTERTSLRAGRGGRKTLTRDETASRSISSFLGRIATARERALTRREPCGRASGTALKTSRPAAPPISRRRPLRAAEEYASVVAFLGQRSVVRMLWDR